MGERFLAALALVVAAGCEALDVFCRSIDDLFAGH